MHGCISIIACEVFRAELELLIEEFQFSYTVHFLPQGLHDDPDQLRVRVQGAIDELESSPCPPDRIFLFYGFCGRGLSGVVSKRTPLVLPRIHDCIPLLLGIPQKEKNALAGSEKTFWMSPGWLKYSQLPFATNRKRRFEEYKEKFGEDSANYLIDMEYSWLSEYTSAGLICWDELDRMSPGIEKTADFVARDAGLEVRKVRGSRQYMLEFLNGAENEDLFFTLPPRNTLSLSLTGDFLATPSDEVE